MLNIFKEAFIPYECQYNKVPVKAPVKTVHEVQFLTNTFIQLMFIFST